MAAPRKAERMELAREGKAQGRSEPGARRGSYPTDTRGRAIAAKARATDAVEAGRMSKATERGIDARADRELNKGTHGMKHGMDRHPGEHSGREAGMKASENHHPGHLKEGIKHLEEHHDEKPREVVREPHRERGHTHKSR